MIFLSHGAHAEPADGMCAMEWCAWAAGERHSDHPECVSLLISAFVRMLNDALRHTERQRLIPVLLDCIGTRVGDEADRRRMVMVLQWVVQPFRLRDMGDVLWCRLQLRATRNCDEHRWMEETLSYSSPEAFRDLQRGWSQAAVEWAVKGVCKGWRSLDSALELVHALCAVGRNPIPLENERSQVLEEAAHAVCRV